MKTEHPRTRKPLKVLSADRIQRKSIVSSTFVEFLAICRGKFKVGDQPVRIVLDDDGTEVDGDYWETLPPNSKLILLTGKDHWIPQGGELGYQYEPQTCSSEKTPEEMDPYDSTSWASEKIPTADVAQKEEAIEEPLAHVADESVPVNLPPEIPCIVGWQHYSVEKKKYIQKKATAENPNAGIRRVSLPETWGYHDMLVLLKSIFFKDGKNETGEVEMMSCYLGSPKGVMIPAEGFSVGSYKSTTKSIKKFYLLTNPRFRLPGMFRDSSQATADSSGRSTPPSSSTTVSGDSAGHSAGPTSSITKTPDSNPKANPGIIYTASSRPSIASTSIKRPTDQQSTASCAIPSPVPIKKGKANYQQVDLARPSLSSSSRNRAKSSSTNPKGRDERPIQQTSATPKENVEKKEKKRCSHCFIRVQDCFLFPCGHSICRRCGEELVSAHLPCPVCERKIENLRSIFD